MATLRTKKLNAAADDPFVPVAVARGLIGRRGKPVARQTVFSLGVRQELDVRMVAGRFVVTRESIEAYRARSQTAA